MNLHPYLTEARYETLRTLRMPGFVGPFLALPVALYLFFGVVLYGPITDRHTATAIFTAFAAFGIMGPAMFGFGIFVATEREHGLLALRRALPAPPASYLLAKMFMAMLFAAANTILMVAAALTLGHLRITFAQAFTVAAVLIPGALPFCALGFLIGTRASAKSAPAFVNLAYLPMIYLSGMIPLPKSLEWIERGSPLFYLGQLAHRALDISAASTVPFAVAVLVAITLLAGSLAVRRLNRVG